ncbi:MAG TPA: hypothetical protein VFA20_20655 [Myxococcaceae bacterium]|nr:hypothetical protein [Myxococcaceae bacterium]
MPRRPEEPTPAGNDQPRKPADPVTSEESLKVARQSLERLRRYLKATAPDEPSTGGRRSA